MAQYVSYELARRQNDWDCQHGSEPQTATLTVDAEDMRVFATLNRESFDADRTRYRDKPHLVLSYEQLVFDPTVRGDLARLTGLDLTHAEASTVRRERRPKLHQACLEPR